MSKSGTILPFLHQRASGKFIAKTRHSVNGSLGKKPERSWVGVWLVASGGEV